MTMTSKSIVHLVGRFLLLLFLVRLGSLEFINFQIKRLQQHTAEAALIAHPQPANSVASDNHKDIVETPTKNTQQSPTASEQHSSQGESSTTVQYSSHQTNSTANTPMVEANQLKSGTHFQPAIGVDFVANLTVSPVGQICVDFEVIGECPIPYIRTRLVGSSLVHIHIKRVSKSHLAGCTMIPIAGLYFLDAVLVHCTMDGMNEALGPGKLRHLCPLKQDDDTTKHYSPFSFTLPPFPNRTLPQNQKWNNFPQSAWIYAPACSEHKTSAECVAYGSNSAVQPMPQFLATKYQETAWLKRNGYFHWQRDERLNLRYSHYVWLPVDMATGRVEYTAYHTMAHHTSPPPYVINKQQQEQQHRNSPKLRAMFVGDSHGRFLRQQVAQIYYNITNGRDGCFEVEESSIVDADPVLGGDRFGYSYLTIARQWLSRERNFTFDHDMYILTMGHWDAGYPQGRPTTAQGFINSLHAMLSRLKELIKPEAEIFVTTVNQHPLGERMLTCVDWRVPPLIDAYNKRLWEQISVDPSNPGPRAFRFIDYSNTYLLDNTDIMDPIWDSSIDWNHPCRNGIRPMALRIMSLLYEYQKGFQV